eukprot:gnl/Hemi2/18048_TR5963_c0_g1_i1.p1 gnl/Hemi2/18048_TR5963_c0_g1~~gnl/Hemi2/18048_TR5963_c0_g1_i1.p1  ORF type:complete len:194 (-),score=35.83 gnl/Hemi2/18048_TR5963_c0_g1_i1:114-665(-)
MASYSNAGYNNQGASWSDWIVADAVPDTDATRFNYDVAQNRDRFVFDQGGMREHERDYSNRSGMARSELEVSDLVSRQMPSPAIQYLGERAPAGGLYDSATAAPGEGSNAWFQRGGLPAGNLGFSDSLEADRLSRGRGTLELEDSRGLRGEYSSTTFNQPMVSGQDSRFLSEQKLTLYGDSSY